MLSFETLRYGQMKGPARAAFILAYARGDSAVPGVVKELEGGSAFRQAGHKLYAVQDAARLEQALETGKYDLILVDAADADTLQRVAQSAPSKPSVLPVLYKSAKTDASRIEKKFHTVLKAPGSSDRYLAAIEQAMATRPRISPPARQ
jgi:DNA-binding NtrC family response regulator